VYRGPVDLLVGAVIFALAVGPVAFLVTVFGGASLIGLWQVRRESRYSREYRRVLREGHTGAVAAVLARHRSRFPYRRRSRR
jgi:hypothetical protein